MPTQTESYREKWLAVLTEFRKTMPYARAASKAVKDRPALHQAMLAEAKANQNRR